MNDTKTTQVYSIYIDAPAEKVWQAITSSEWTNKYGYGGDLDIELRPGGAYRNHATAEMKEMGMPDIVTTGEVLEADPPKKLVLMWKPVWLEEPATRLTYELEQFADGQLTRLVLTHELADAPETARQVAGGADPGTGGGGWPWVLAGLKTALETGRAMVGSGA